MYTVEWSPGPSVLDKPCHFVVTAGTSVVATCS